MTRPKPAAAKGRYLRKVTFTTTMGPGIPVDPNKTRGFTEELAEASLHRLTLSGATRLPSCSGATTASLPPSGASAMDCGSVTPLRGV